MAELNLIIQAAIEEIPTDCSQCDLCGDKILGKMFVLVLYLGDMSADTNLKICESCNDLRLETK